MDPTILEPKIYRAARLAHHTVASTDPVSGMRRRYADADALSTELTAYFAAFDHSMGQPWLKTLEFPDLKTKQVESAKRNVALMRLCSGCFAAAQFALIYPRHIPGEAPSAWCTDFRSAVTDIHRLLGPALVAKFQQIATKPQTERHARRRREGATLAIWDKWPRHGLDYELVLQACAARLSIVRSGLVESVISWIVSHLFDDKES